MSKLTQIGNQMADLIMRLPESDDAIIFDLRNYAKRWQDTVSPIVYGESECWVCGTTELDNADEGHMNWKLGFRVRNKLLCSRCFARTR